MYRTLWVRDKVALVSRLASNEPLGAYPETMIILCAIISAMASDFWPGRAGDRVRFVETLQRFAPTHLNVDRISIPVLLETLRKLPGWSDELRKVEKAFLNYDFTRVLTGNEIDQAESEILRLCPRLPVTDIRGCSYANLLYEEVRCAYSHEYRPGTRAASVPMSTRFGEAVSYVNVITTLSEFGAVDITERKIHFHWHWVSELVLALAEKLDSLPGAVQQEIPSQWWLRP